jgi:uncharacterized membrane protein YkvI
VIGAVVGALIGGLIASVIMFVIWLALIKHFFDCGWIMALAIAIIADILRSNNCSARVYWHWGIGIHLD